MGDMDKKEDNNRTIWSREVKKVRVSVEGGGKTILPMLKKMSRKVDGKVEVREVVG